MKSIWIVILSLGMSVALAQGPRDTCVACHGVDGNSTTPLWPKIAGQSQQYFIKQMRDFQKGESGKRYDPSMSGMVAGLSEEDFVALADYYASQEIMLGAVPEQWVSLGEQLYRGGDRGRGVPACSGCHAPSGQGNAPAGFPRLSGQHPEYIIEQLKKFQNGQRSNDPNGMMQDIAKRMTPEQMEAVAHYVSGLYE